MIHEANNETSDVYLANQYRAMYGHAAGGYVALDPRVLDKKPNEKSTVSSTRTSSSAPPSGTTGARASSSNGMRMDPNSPN